MPARKRLVRLLTIAAVFTGMTLATAAPADAAIFGRRSAGITVRGPSPLKFRVSPAKYKRLKTFYPTIYRRVR